MNPASLSTALGSDDLSSDKTDILVPLDPDGHRITWPSGSNPAYLPGIRFELAEYYKRKLSFISDPPFAAPAPHPSPSEQQPA